MPTKAPLHSWEWATAPWQRMYIDYAGSFQNSMFLVVVDAHSKWPEVIPVSSTTSSSNIERSYAIYSPDSEFLNRSLVTMVHNLFLRSSRRSSGQCQVQWHPPYNISTIPSSYKRSSGEGSTNLQASSTFHVSKLKASEGEVGKVSHSSGADPGFFLGGGALVSCSTSTPINHIVLFFFFAEYQLYEKTAGHLREGCTPPAPSP